MHLTLMFQLDTSSALPLHSQIYKALRSAILNQRLVAGTRLPATRILAQELAVLRNTVYSPSKSGRGSRPGSGARRHLHRSNMATRCTLVERAAACDVALQPLASYAIEPLARQGFLSGYAAATPDEISAAVRGLVGMFGNER